MRYTHSNIALKHQGRTLKQCPLCRETPTTRGTCGCGYQWGPRAGDPPADHWTPCGQYAAGMMYAAGYQD